MIRIFFIEIFRVLTLNNSYFCRSEKDSLHTPIMKQKLIFFFTACLLSLTTQAQTPETEPNNSPTDAGVQTITSDGSYSGSFSFTDLEYYRIAPNTGGTITVTFTNAPAANGIFLAPYPSGSSLVTASNPGSFTYVLNPLSNYMLYTGTGTATGNWKFTISGLSAVSASVAGNDALCYGGSSGTATVTASGAAPFTYSWSPAGGTSPVATGLTAGNYSVLVTNATGVSVTKTLSIIQPAALSAGSAITPPACHSGYGSATVTASGGTGPYNFQWSNSQSGPSGTFLHAGTYTVTVTDDHNCGLTKTVTVTEPGAIYYTFSPGGIACHGGSGTASVSATGGSGSYTYSWSTGATSSSVSNLPPGTHSVTVTDTYGCAGTMSATFTDPPALTSTTNTVSATCINPGSATVTASGGTGIYTYSWSTAATTPTVSLNAGSYTVTVKDVNNCSSSQVVNISAPAPLTLTATASSASVCAGETVTLTANSGGGTGAITYTWAPGFHATTYTVAPSISNTYTVNISDINGCTAAGSVFITAGPVPTLAVNNATICSGSSHTIVPSGAASYTITGNNFTVAPTGTTTYSIIGAGANGCMATNTAVVTVSVNIPPTVTVNNMAICPGQTATLVPGGASTYTITGANFTVSPASTTSYSVTGTDSHGCLSSNTAIATVTVNQTPTLTVNNATICSGGSATLIPAGVDTYSITGGSFTVSPSISTTFLVTGTSAAGCISVPVTATVLVNALPTVTAASSNATLCAGESATLTAGGAITYSWSSSQTTPEVVVSSSLPLSQTYTVTGTDANGCVNMATLTQVFDVCTGLSPASNDGPAVSLFPNPSSGAMTAQFNVEGRKEITIIDGTGRTVLTLATDNPFQVIDLSSYAKGMYVAHLRSGALIKTFRIVLE